MENEWSGQQGSVIRWGTEPRAGRDKNVVFSVYKSVAPALGFSTNMQV